MKTNVRNLVRGALIAALYVVLSHLQNILVPGSASYMIQFRVAEALCVLALFTPSAVWGLTVGCIVFNVTSGTGLPLDLIVGPIASALAGVFMYQTRRITLWGYPLPAMCMPALFNGFLVGWELYFHMGHGFWINVMYVAIGEAAVLFTLGSVLYYVLRSGGLSRRLFS